ncbi:hypothetical protein KCP71_13860 [Salmonella enterica subsp. enterica]|nr:hypothetical protein KCP71_13860 [Salmonella enterica subsp. enterica]
MKLFDDKTVAQFTRRSPEDAAFGQGWRTLAAALNDPTFGGISQSANDMDIPDGPAR